jgi:DNA-binding transcriptional LysR family regulator
LLFKEILTPMCTPALAPSLRSPNQLKSATLLHPGIGGAEWKCWLQQIGCGDMDVGRGLVFDTLDLTLTAAAEGHGVAIGDPRMAADRLERGELIMPFPQEVENGAAYYFTFPLQRTGKPAIRALADVLVRLAAEGATPPASP